MEMLASVAPQLKYYSDYGGRITLRFGKLHFIQIISNNISPVMQANDVKFSSGNVLVRNLHHICIYLKQP